MAELGAPSADSARAPRAGSALRPWWWRRGSLAGPICAVGAGILLAVAGFSGWTGASGRRDWAVAVVGMVWATLVILIVAGTRFMAGRLAGIDARELDRPRRGDLGGRLVFTGVLLAGGVWGAFFADGNDRGARSGLPLPILGWILLLISVVMLADTVRRRRT